jgi:glutathione S-transferase
MASPPPRRIRRIISSLPQCVSMHNMLGLHYKSWVWTMKWWLSTTRQAARLSWVLVAIRWQTWFIDGAHAKVPLLQVLDKNNVFLFKSLIVSQYIADKHHVLLPSSHEDVAIMHSLQNSVAFPSCFPSLRAKNKEKLEAAIQMFWQELGATDTFLTHHGTEEGPFLFGNAFSLAERINAAQFVQHACTILPALTGPME